MRNKLKKEDLIWLVVRASDHKTVFRTSSKEAALAFGSDCLPAVRHYVVAQGR